MKKILLLFTMTVFCIEASCQLDSAQSPVIWLRADKSELTPTSWKDQGLFQHHAAILSPQEMPSDSAMINYNNALQFDGVDDYMMIPFSMDGLADLSVLAVFQSADTTERGIWGSEESIRNILLTTRKAIGPDTISDNYGNNEKLTILNAVLQNWESTNAGLSSGFVALGSAGKSKPFMPFKGKLAELIVFDHSLPALERIKYETYLALKYGTGLKGGNFVSSAEKVLWRVEENKAFGSNIAGIGRDDEFALYQKQSGSAYDSGLLVMNAGILAKSNNNNTGTINDQNFVLWGDNGLPLQTLRGEGIDSVLSVIQRRWLVTATGTTTNSMPVEVHLNASKFPADPLGYWLVIDRTAKGNFSVDHLEYILPDHIADGKVVYKNVLWDTDGSGKDNFGFARAHDLLAVVRKISDPLCSDTTAGEVRIEIFGGNPPFKYSLSNPERGIAREWQQSALPVNVSDLEAGNYSLQVVDDDAETSKRRFSVLMPDALYIDLGPDQILSKTAEGSEIILDVSDQVPDSVDVSYLWENNFGFHSSEKRIVVSESGIYRVSVIKSSDGCVFSDDVTISGSDEERIAVYPNLLKAHDTYNVSVSLQEAGSVSIKVFNSMGLEVHSAGGRDRSEYQFSASLRESGMYLVVVRTPKGTQMRKVVVQ